MYIYIYIWDHNIGSEHAWARVCVHAWTSVVDEHDQEPLALAFPSAVFTPACSLAAPPMDLQSLPTKRHVPADYIPHTPKKPETKNNLFMNMKCQNLSYPLAFPGALPWLQGSFENQKTKPSKEIPLNIQSTHRF